MKNSIFRSPISQSQAVANNSGGSFAPVMIQKEPAKVTPKTDENDEKLKAAALKVGEAFLKTDIAKKLIEDDKLVKWGKKTGQEFIDTWYGKTIAGVVAAGYVGSFTIANKKLPIQLPELPLDFIHDGLSLQFKSEGPINDKPAFSISINFTEQVKKKASQTPTEKFREETAKMQRENAKWQERFKTPEQKRDEDMTEKYLHDQMIKKMSSMLKLPSVPEKTEE